MAPEHLQLQIFHVSRCFIKLFYKTTTFEWLPEWSSYTGSTVMIRLWLVKWLVNMVMMVVVMFDSYNSGTNDVDDSEIDANDDVIIMQMIMN